LRGLVLSNFVFAVFCNIRCFKFVEKWNCILY
jgi:hypothetical protein